MSPYIKIRRVISNIHQMDFLYAYKIKFDVTEFLNSKDICGFSPTSFIIGMSLDIL